MITTVESRQTQKQITTLTLDFMTECSVGTMGLP
jgi:hypothetical protein